MAWIWSLLSGCSASIRSPFIQLLFLVCHRKEPNLKNSRYSVTFKIFSVSLNHDPEHCRCDRIWSLYLLMLLVPFSKLLKITVTFSSERAAECTCDGNFDLAPGLEICKRHVVHAARKSNVFLLA